VLGGKLLLCSLSLGVSPEQDFSLENWSYWERFWARQENVCYLPVSKPPHILETKAVWLDFSIIPGSCWSCIPVTFANDMTTKTNHLTFTGCINDRLRCRVIQEQLTSSKYWARTISGGLWMWSFTQGCMVGIHNKPILVRLQDEMSVEDRMVPLGSQIIVPGSLRGTVLQQIRKGRFYWKSETASLLLRLLTRHLHRKSLVVWCNVCLKNTKALNKWILRYPQRLHSVLGKRSEHFCLASSSRGCALMSTTILSSGLSKNYLTSQLIPLWMPQTPCTLRMSESL